MINYAYKVYSGTKKIIVAAGGYLPHVEPEYLFQYEDYNTFNKIIRPLRKDFSKQKSMRYVPQSTFMRLHKQCWLDLCLQLYKTYVLARVSCPTDSALLVNGDTSDGDTENINTINAGFFRSFKTATILNARVFNKSETLLLYWLQYHFDRKAKVLWDLFGKTEPPKRDITDFGSSLRDSLVLTVLTLTFCPYLLSYAKEPYLEPISDDLALHNAACLLQLWDQLNLSFAMTPRQIVTSNRVQMVMLVTYLYQILPTFFPSTTIKFKTGLSKSCSDEISIENPNNFAISYQVIFLGNKNKLFTVPECNVKIEPKTTFRLKILFDAKRLVKEEATIILNGETAPENYARSRAYQLVGEPIPSYATSTFSLPICLYQNSKHELQIESPYKTYGSYTISYTINEPNDISTCDFSQIPDSKRPMQLSRIGFDRGYLHCDESGTGTILFSITSVLPYTISTWIAFRCRNIGDFTIEIITSPDYINAISSDIPLLLPQNYILRGCTCDNMQKVVQIKMCPRKLVLQIPNQHESLWNAILTVLQKNALPNETEFWNKYKGTTACIEVIKWYIETHQEVDDKLAQIFQKSVKYRITTDKAELTAIPNTLQINNVQLLGYQELHIHVRDKQKIPEKFLLTMVAESNLEYRRYNIIVNKNSCTDTP